MIACAENVSECKIYFIYIYLLLLDKFAGLNRLLICKRKYSLLPPLHPPPHTLTLLNLSVGCDIISMLSQGIMCPLFRVFSISVASLSCV